MENSLLNKCDTKSTILQKTGLDFIEMKHFCSVKRMKRQATEWQKIFASYEFNKDPITHPNG